MSPRLRSNTNFIISGHPCLSKHKFSRKTRHDNCDLFLKLPVPPRCTVRTFISLHAAGIVALWVTNAFTGTINITPLHSGQKMQFKSHCQLRVNTVLKIMKHNRGLPVHCCWRQYSFVLL